MCSRDSSARRMVSSVSWVYRQLHEAGQLEHCSLAKLRAAQNDVLGQNIEIIICIDWRLEVFSWKTIALYVQVLENFSGTKGVGFT